MKLTAALVLAVSLAACANLPGNASDSPFPQTAPMAPGQIM
jgi:hypothetical protein